MLPSSNSPSAPSLPVPRPRPAVGSGGGSKSPVRTEHDGERACGVEASVREDCPGGGGCIPAFPRQRPGASGGRVLSVFQHTCTCRPTRCACARRPNRRDVAPPPPPPGRHVHPGRGKRGPSLRAYRPTSFAHMQAGTDVEWGGQRLCPGWRLVIRRDGGGGGGAGASGE